MLLSCGATFGWWVIRSVLVTIYKSELGQAQSQLVVVVYDDYAVVVFLVVLSQKPSIKVWSKSGQ